MSLQVAADKEGAAGWLRASVTQASRATLVVAALTVAVFVFRLTQLHQSLFGDEVFTYQDVVGRSLGAAVREVRTGAENSPPLFFVLAWLCSKLGDPTVWIRLPSLLLGTATIPLIYLLGRETIGRRGAVIGAAIVAFSPFSTYYGIEARPYATMAFFVTLSTLALVRAVRSGSRAWWAAYAVAAAGAAYSHYTSVFVLGALAAWSLWMCRKRLREPIVANAFALLLYLPWIPNVRGKALAVIGGLEPLTFHNVAVDLLRVIPGYPYAPLRAIPTTVGLVAVAVCVLLGFAWMARGPMSARVSATRDARWDRAALIVACALAAPAGLLLYSLLGTDIWDARDLYSSVPAAALVLGALLAAIPRAARVAAVPVFLVVLAAGSIRAISPSYARPPFRTAAAYLDRVAAPHDPVIMYTAFLNLEQAIVVQLKQRHRVVDEVGARWPQPPRGGADYAIVDDTVERLLKIGIPHPAAFELVARRHYSGLIPFSLLTYRPTNR